MSVADVALSPFSKESVRSAEYINRDLAIGLSESIVIYLTVAGSVIPMRVLESDSIGSVKLRIQTCKGFYVKRQKLIFGGRLLARNDSLLKDYGVSSGNVLHLVVKLSDLLLITVRTVCGKVCEFHVDRHRNVGYIKRRIAKKEEGFSDIEDQELFYNSEKLEDQTVIHDVCNASDAVVHLVIQQSAKVWAEPIERDVELSIVAANWSERTDGVAEEDKDESRELQVVAKVLPDVNVLLEPIIVNPKVILPSFVWHMTNAVLDGLIKGRPPIRSSEGTGGTYFMQDASGNKYIAVFKPTDEEPMAVNNPQELPLSSNGEGLKRGTRVGEGALREVAAFLLDHPKAGPRWLPSEELGFAGVPPTVMVRCLHKGFNHREGFECSYKNIKVGSLQKFMRNHGSCEDMGPCDFPVEEVHKISVLDIRIANADRHAGNILVSREGEQGRIALIPIDHGYCLPETFEDCTFDWLYWPQARQSYSPEIVSYIRSLDAEQDIALLKFYGWELSPECVRTLRISTMLLKKGAEIGLSPYAIGSIMCRENVNKKAMIEEIIHEAQECVLPDTSEAAFLEMVSEIMDIQLHKLMKSTS